MRFLELFKKSGLSVIIYLLLGLIVINAGVIFYMNRSVYKSRRLAELSESVKPKINDLRNTAASVDVVARNGVIMQDAATLKQYDALLQTFELNFDSLKYFLLRQDIGEDAALKRMDDGISHAVQSHRKFLSTLQGGDSTQIMNEFNELYGAFNAVEEFSGDLFQTWDESRQQVRASSRNLYNLVIVLQVIMLISIPVLILVSVTLRSYRKKLLSMNREIDESNRKYVFDSMEDVDYANEEDIKTRLLNNLKKAADFIQNISNGNYDVKWGGFTDANRERNQENIAGELIRMREQMKKVKEQDQSRIWSTEGLSKFGEIIRRHQDNFDTLADSLIQNVVKYVGAKVGGLFILEEDETGVKHLQLRACYAYDRKKFITKKVDVGEGLVGQAFLEGQTIYLTEVPDEYMLITSGLGDTNPRSLVVIPLKTNDRIEGVLELASLNEFKPYEIEFLERLAETLASSIISVRTAEKTKSLLQISQEQSEEMRAQEEEMRQNMEELEATQEQMARQMAELNSLKESLQKEQYLFNALMDNLPDSIYFKDRECKLIRVSKYMSKHFGTSTDALIGKSDFDFQDEAHAQEAYDDEQNIMRTRQPKIDYIEKETKEDGSEHWVSTTKMPLVNLQGEVVGTFGISRDVSRLKKLEIDVLEKDKRLQAEEKEFEERIKTLEDTLRTKEEELAKMKKILAAQSGK